MYPIGANDAVRDKLLKHLEESGKFSPKAYLDTEGLPTIGWGNRFHLDGREVRMGDSISQEDADRLYSQAITKHVKALRAEPSYSKFNPNQQAALESFAYNAGPYFLQSKDYQTITRAIRSGNPDEVRKALPIYRNAGVLDNRRRQELELFDKPWASPKPTPKKKSTTSARNQLTVEGVKKILGPLFNLKINR